MPSTRLTKNGAHLATEWVNGNRSLRAKRQYAALLEAVGTTSAARKLMEDVIVWQSPARPPDHLVKLWELEWSEGSYAATDLEVKRMKQRLMAFEEWGNRFAIRALREALEEVAGQAKNNTLDLKRQVSLKYLADGLAMNTRDTSQAYGTPKPTPNQINKLVINAGAPPQRKLREKKVEALPEPIIEAEFTVEPSPITEAVRQRLKNDNSDSA